MSTDSNSLGTALQLSSSIESLQGLLRYIQFMRAILAGGGTGGHVIPALAIANQLKATYNAECLFIGTARGIENRLVPAAGFPLQLVRVGALKNVSLVTRLKTAFDLPRALWDAGRMLNEFAPDVVIGVGGYASGPAMLSAVVKHIPTLAFEPNVVPGFANRDCGEVRFRSGGSFRGDGQVFSTCRSHRRSRAAGVFRNSAQTGWNANSSRLRRQPGRARDQRSHVSLLASAPARGAGNPHHPSDRRA